MNTEAASLSNTRTYARNKLESILGDEKKAKNLEILTYNYLISSSTSKSIQKNWKDIKFRRIYLEKLRSLVANLKKFPNLKKELASSLFKMERQDFNPEIWNPIIEKVEKRNAYKTQLLPDDYVGIYCCPRCKSMKTTFYVMQVKSADELSHRFIC